MAVGLVELGVNLDLTTVQTNIICFQVPMTADEFIKALADRGVLANATGPNSVRFVTHYEVSQGDVDKALAACAEVLL